MPTPSKLTAAGRLESYRKKYTVSARHFKISLGVQTKIMGILNITPDSFSRDGTVRNNKIDPAKNVAFVQKLIAGGADFIDVGGESTRPGALPISEREEARRVIPTIRLLAKKTRVPISVDTYKENVAKEALENGASIINNIMGASVSESFLKMVKSYNATIVLMHIRGTPQTMQTHTHYRNLVNDIIRELRKSVEKCLEIGIKSDKIIIDPGIGFSKTAEQNLEIIRRLKEFGVLNKPILIGTSRKSFIGKVLNRDVSGRLMGTAASVAISILNGAHIVRAHDVEEIKDVVRISDAVLSTC